MENFEANNVSEEGVPVPENEEVGEGVSKEETKEGWANKGELLRKKNIEEGDKSCVNKYIKALDEIKNLESFK